MREITIILAEDHKVVRQGLRKVLETEPDFCIIGEAGQGREAVRLVERLHPDVLVLDLLMPNLGGLEATRHVKKHSKKTQVVILSMHKDESYVLEALRNGAAAYVLKESSSNELIQAVREVVAGRRYLSPPLSDAAIEAYMQRVNATATDSYDTLTTREREVLQLAAEGWTSSEIGKQLFISPRTVEIHRGSMMYKLALRSQTDLIRYALKRGILPNN